MPRSLRVYRPGASSAIQPPSRSRAVRVLLSLLAVAAGAPTAHAQGPKPITADVWTRAVDAYVDGRYTEAGLSLVHLDLSAAGQVVRTTGDEWLTEGTAHAGRRLKAGAAVALELALAHAAADGDASARTLLDAARDAIRRLEVGERRQGDRTVERAEAWQAQRFAAVWRLSHLQFLLATRQLPEVERAAQRRDLDVLPDALRAEWHVARGAAREAISRLWLESDRLGPMPTRGFAMTSTRVQWIDRTLDEAAAHYRGALALDETHAEANLRLGRVLFERGRGAEARRHLERAARRPCRDIVCGLAWLFLGELHGEAGDPVAARDAYVSASSVLDIRQSALIGMLRETMSDQPAVAEGITRQFDDTGMLASQPVGDSWSRYLTGAPLQLRHIIEALRAEVHR